MSLAAFNLAFLLPAGLAALAALLLPLLIHLARRSEQRPTEFAALRWLRQKPKPRHRIRFDEWLLLAVRLLLLVVLALLLARPVLFGGADTKPRVAVVPGVDVRQARAEAAATDARFVWLAPGFPPIDSPPPTTAPVSAPPVTSLLRELDASLPEGVALTVLVPAELEGADGQRPRLGRRVQWRVMPGSMPASPSAKPAAAPVLSVRYADGREGTLRYLRAAQAAWSAGDGKHAAGHADVARATQALAPGARELVWLVPGPLPSALVDWIRSGGNVLLDSEAVLADAPPMAALWRNDEGATLVEGAALGAGRVMRLTHVLSPEAMPGLLDADFPHRLRALFEASAAAPTRAAAADLAPESGGPLFPQPPRELQTWLVVLAALLFLLERALASGRRRGVAP